MNLPISNYITYDGRWDITSIDALLPDAIIQKIHDTTPPSITQNEDSFYWGITSDGKFSSKSAYASLHEIDSNGNQTIFKAIWDWRGIERIRYLLWKLGHESILTNAERHRRRMSTSNLCPICNLEAETLFHYFRDCDRSKLLWQKFNIKHKVRFFTVSNWKLWLEENLRNLRKEDGEGNWDLLFGVVLDAIWRNRNEWVFDQKQSPISHNLISIRCQVTAIVDAMKMNIMLNPKQSSVMIVADSHWIPPAKGFWKLNCDGSVRNHGRDAGCGGVLRDCYGRFVFAFSQKLDACSVVEAELWSIYHGICLAWGKGYLKLLVETDSSEAMRLMEEGNSSEEDVQRLINGIKNIGRDSIEVGWSRVDRALNTCADSLAKNSYKIRDPTVIYNLMPDFLVDVIAKDSIGLASPSMN